MARYRNPEVPVLLLLVMVAPEAERVDTPYDFADPPVSVTTMENGVAENGF